jgi:hypothetical protein
LLNGAVLNLAKDYLVAAGTYQVHPLVSLSISSNSNFNDGSGYLAGTVSYSASNNSSISLGTLFTYGKTFTEYWYYPQSYYVKLETYF